MKKVLFVIVCFIICILSFPLETHENVAIKVLAQIILVIVLGIIFFIVHYFVYDLPTKVKKERYEQNYPIPSDRNPLSCISKGDIVFLKDYGECIYDGKRMFGGKYVIWIKRKGQNEMKELTDDELLSQLQQVSCEFGLKWGKSS